MRQVTANNPLTALACFREGFTLLRHPQLRQLVVIPILINILLYGVALGLSYYSVAGFISHFIPLWLMWLRWLIWPLFFISFFVAVFFTFTLLANLLCTPFYGKLSEQTLSIISGETAIIHNLPLGKVLWAEIRRLLHIGSRTLPLLIISVIPVVNLIAPVLWGLLGAWGMGLEFLVYPMENDGLVFNEQKRQLKTMRLGALSFGGITMLGLTVPLLNILMPPVAVISATIYWYRLKAARA